jgi:hypothetical protein
VSRAGAGVRWAGGDVEGQKWVAVVQSRKPGSRTTGGNGAAVSGVTEERALGGFKNLLSVAREREREPEILRHENPYYVHLSFPHMGDERNTCVPHISLKRETDSY